MNEAIKYFLIGYAAGIISAGIFTIKNILRNRRTTAGARSGVEEARGTCEELAGSTKRVGSILQRIRKQECKDSN